MQVTIEEELALRVISSFASFFCEQNPFQGSSNFHKWSRFEMRPYDWDNDGDQSWHFKWRDFEVRLHHEFYIDGSQCNRRLSVEEIKCMVRECASAIMAKSPKIVERACRRFPISKGIEQ
jgi:hypothetical protein